MNVNHFSALSDEKDFREMLKGDSGCLDRIVDVANSESCPRWLFGMVISFLTGLDVEDDEAREHYFNIIDRKYVLSDRLNRDIGFRVAALDYFFNCSKLLKNPKFVEIDFYEKILALSKEDTKLGCFNMNYFAGVMANEIRRAERYDQNLSIILIDIDDFKGINDTHGHLFGDKILEMFVGAIQSNLRGEDILARYGGDEFIILLPQTGRVGARTMADRIRHRLMDYFYGLDFSRDGVQVRFSAGISTYPYDADDYEALVECADKALYKSKLLGKNMIYDYHESREDHVLTVTAGDKRSAPRFSVLTENAVDLMGDSSLMGVDGRIVNIGPAGAFIECRCAPLDNISEMPMSLVLKRLGESVMDDLHITGNVVRVNNESHSLKFHLALKFDSMLSAIDWNSIRRSGKLVPI